jgi:AcrR family transcriptional regulator
VFSELGYDATTFQAIADRAGLTRPAINYYFGSKPHLYRQVVESTRATVVSAAIRNAIAAPTLFAQLSVFIDAITQVSADDGSTAAFLVTALLDSQRHPDLPKGAIAETREFLTWAINGAVERGELAIDTNASALVEMLLAIMWGICFYAGFLDSGERVALMADQLRRLLPGQQRTLPS